MKPTKLLALIAVCMLCMNVKCPTYYGDDFYTSYKPVFIKRADLENSIKFDSARALINPAKIYAIGNVILISEAYKGVHIIDNSNPKNPINKGFIRVVGCLDMAVKGSTIYVDNAVDLVPIKMSDPYNPIIGQRIVNVFPEPTPPDMGGIPVEFNKENRPADLIIVEWQKK